MNSGSCQNLTAQTDYKIMLANIFMSGSTCSLLTNIVEEKLKLAYSKADTSSQKNEQKRQAGSSANGVRDKA